MIIDRTTYAKPRVLPEGRGYSRRSRTIRAIVIHTTNGNKGSTFAGEARYLQTSTQVSAEYLVGKNGEIAELLDPVRYAAWHTGLAISGWENQDTIGIECHHAVGDTWPAAQMDALTALVRYLMARYNIPVDRVQTHRYIARPVGRKVDPSDWSDAAFYAWRDTLEASAGPNAVIGVQQRATRDACWRSCLRNQARLIREEHDRCYTLAESLGIDMAFVLALIAYESQYGNSELALITNNPGNIKAAPGEWRATREGRGSRWLAYESVQLGLLALILHLKNEYGWARHLHTVEAIADSYANEEDGNDPALWARRVLENMAYIISH